ncbi:hypothetical protein CLU79DRAFT_834495 [Phycomyces nitens]|nr:hypothetical protein CLU79DRAFT_834495 [Phycomyces nitens]
MAISPPPTIAPTIAPSDVTKSNIFVASTSKPVQVPVILFSNLPRLSDQVLCEIPEEYSLGVTFPTKPPFIHEMHMSNSFICANICTKGFLVGDSMYFPSQGISKGTQLLRIYLTQLPFIPRSEFEQTIKTALSTYGVVRKIGLNLRLDFFDGTGFTYI